MHVLDVTMTAMHDISHLDYNEVEWTDQLPRVTYGSRHKSLYNTQTVRVVWICVPMSYR